MAEHLIPQRRAGIALTSAVLIAVSLTACSTPTAASSPPSGTPGSTSAPASSSAPVERQTHIVSNAGHKLVFHVVDGKLPALVLDAGGGSDSSYWKELAPRLAKATGSKVITYDRAGEGDSDEVPGPWKVENAVSDLEAGLEELGVPKDVVLVSHSIAGEVATNFAVKNPDWVSGAVLVDANVPDFFSDGMLTAFEPVVEAQRTALLAQESTKKNRQLLAVLAEYGPAHRAYHQLSWPQDVPVTVIVSAKTPFDTPDAAKLWRDAQAHFAQAAPNRELVVAENSSHDVAGDRPDVIAEAVDDLVKTIR